MIRTRAFTNLKKAKRVLVTGSRGKSSLVRLIFSAFKASGFKVHARITGVVPRHLYGENGKVILRLSGGHVEETRWWLKKLPASTEAVILENNAVDPFLQHLAADWLRPDLIVLTNTRPDHQEVWGPNSGHAARALLAGIPANSQVVLSWEAASQSGVLAELSKKKVAFSVTQKPCQGGEAGHKEHNMALALRACQNLGLEQETCLAAMQGLAPDLADFQVKAVGAGAKLAVGFAINDLKSTEDAFASLGWSCEKTVLLFNHRRDRPLRLREFFSFIKKPWQKVVLIGDRPGPLPFASAYCRLGSLADFYKLFKPGNNYFGCGNLAGHPLAFLLKPAINQSQAAFAEPCAQEPRSSIYAPH
jgi:poly-gamma-glutamate synthase PgsB/CapB